MVAISFLIGEINAWQIEAERKRNFQFFFRNKNLWEIKYLGMSL